MTVQTVPGKVQENGTQIASRPAYYAKRDGSWQKTTWGEYATQVRNAAKALIAMGVAPGDPIAILGFNRPEWIIMDVAAMSVGAVPAGIYTTNSPSECHYILDHSGAPVILVEDEGQLDKIRQVRGDLASLRAVVTMEGVDAVEDDGVHTWDSFMGMGAEVSDDHFQQRLDALQADDLATLIYTSGTTGKPKGVMLSHDNLVWTALRAADAFGINGDDEGISYLPLSHIAEQMFSIHLPTIVGSSVSFAESIDKLAENLKEIKPTVFFAVPRVWERFHAGITANLAETTGAKAKIGAWAMGIGRKVADLRNEGKEPSGALAAQYKIADKLVFHKVKQALGMERARVVSSGAAPISKELLEFMSGLDLIITEVYGQSEDTGPTSTNVPGRTRFGSVGPAYPGVDVKIADDGEILVKGRNVFLGYYKDEAATAETLKDGWLYSGDLGRFDSDGFLHITGRKKDIIITAGGKNVAPKAMEGVLKSSPLISEAVLIGDRRKYLTALITLDEEAAARFMADAGLEGEPHDDPTVMAALEELVDKANQEFARVEQLKKFCVLPRQLTIEDGELTPTLKVKRNVVNDHFSDLIEGMYAD
ncbi:MAG: AMP-binding protein [Acidimicrobiia bacterium]|nr:AMP-binding protein [Acidimicrobiia bacterium]